MMSPWPRNSNFGFTLVELLVVIVVLLLLAGLFLPNIRCVRERAGSKVHCLSNLIGIWKSIAALDLGSDDTFGLNFPTSNLVGPNGILTPIGDVTPELFVCPQAAGYYGTRPATTLSEMTASNSSYCYFGGRSYKDGDMVLLCDQDGPMTVATINHWGLNHRGKKGQAMGGNIVKVGGSGMWVSTTNDPAMSAVCITNAAISAAFQTNSDTVVFLY